MKTCMISTLQFTTSLNMMLVIVQSVCARGRMLVSNLYKRMKFVCDDQKWDKQMVGWTIRANCEGATPS